MGRKRKGSSSVISRAVMPAAQRVRTISTRLTPTGRIGPATSSFVTPAPASLLSVSHSTTSPSQGESEALGNTTELEDSFFNDPEVLSSSNNPHVVQIEANDDTPILDWLKNHRDVYLEQQLLCTECFTDLHRFLPFHRALVCNVVCST